MSLAEVRALSRNRYPTKGLALSLGDNPTEQAILEVPVCYMYDDDSGIVLYFNSINVLIHKARIKYFGVNIPELVDSFRRP
jgi:hypothetical protein